MKNILVIEDSKIINSVIKKELSKLHFIIDQAYTLQEAKDFLSHQIYTLIILDMHLPDGEGSELIANIQSLTKTKVVVLTSSQDEDLRKELFQYGVLDYIIKDKNLLYSISEIVKIINTILDNEQEKEKILVIDDSKFICKQVKIVLEPRNYKVFRALNAKNGLTLLDKEDFKLIILDMELPDIHGVEVLNLIRKKQNYISVPIIVLSGTSTPEIIRNVLKNGANDFLKKPFVYEEFLLKVDLWIDYFKKSAELEVKTQELKFLNKHLEELVASEVEKNRQKDKIMFAQSRQAQMGEMIAMIAHQWRQPLNAISAASSVIELKVKNNQFDKVTAKKITSRIQQYLQHLSATIDDFRDFFKPQREMYLSSFEIIAAKAYSLIENNLSKKKIDIEIYIEEVSSFMTYENELVQVVLNLIKNAQDILEEKKVSHPKIEIIVKNNCLSVRDNGGGIAEDILPKIFNPYFSTKLQKDGTGLGLYMSRIIVEEHCNGELLVKNIENGAEFSIVLHEQSDGGGKLNEYEIFFSGKR